MTARLFVSFWDVCLENLPVGRFERRQVTVSEAKALMAGARDAEALCCASKDDLFAPYEADALRKHEQLCAVLASCHGIELSMQDFLLRDDDNTSTVMPLSLVRLSPGDCLLVIGCGYTLADGPGRLDERFDIAEDSLTFDLIEAASPPNAAA